MIDRPFRRPFLRRASTPHCLAALLTLFGLASPALGFCGFYVAKAETDLFNQASKVVVVRDGDRTVITMANDFRGDPREFAMVVPVPTFLEREQIHVGDSAVIDHLDAYTAPRLVEYFDPDPCRREIREEVMMRLSDAAEPTVEAGSPQRARKLGVTIEAEYSVGEYDISILSAKESRGLETWLRENGYRLPEGAASILSSYLAQGMRFFVAKIDLEERSALGFRYLRPLQIAFETPKFMLPIRLGTLNADGPQELFVWMLTRNGRVETTNYRTVALPSDVEVPGFVDQDFGDFYRALFAHQVEKERMRTVFMEYAWDMSWCDPCAADPLSAAQLRDLGVFWLDDGAAAPDRSRARVAPQAQNVYVTRLHLRYTADTFPDDLRFQTTGNRQNFQGRYVVHRPFTGDGSSCPAARDYERQLEKRRERWAGNLSNLTGWPVAEVRSRMGWQGRADEPADDRPWWQKIWGDDDARGGP